MEISRKVLGQLRADGITSESKPGTIRKAFTKATGEKLDAAGLALVIEAIDNVGEAKVLTLDERMAKAKGIVKERAGDPDMPGWANVRKVVETGETGNPTRVEIGCADPQEKGGVSVCAKTREIAAQDVFQVSRCLPCQRRAFILTRGAKAKAKRAARREASKQVAAQAKERTSKKGATPKIGKLDKAQADQARDDQALRPAAKGGAPIRPSARKIA